MVLNIVWVGFILIGFAVALIRVVQGDSTLFSTMLDGMFDSAKSGFTISLGLVGVMSLWLGIMKIGEKAGVIQLFARALSPFYARVFPEVPKGHPAGGSMVMNFSANMLGLDNAATPLGLKAMKELQEINPQKDTASNAMIMFLVLNTAGITLIPTSVIAMRQSIAIEQHLTNFNPADIFLPVLISTFIAFVTGLVTVGLVQGVKLFSLPVLTFCGGFMLLMGGVFAWLHGYPPDVMSRYIGQLGSGVILFIVILFIAVGAWRRVNVYDAFVEGAREGFTVAIQIIPYLIAILVAISIFRTSGCMDYVVKAITFCVAAVGLPTDWVPALPVGLMKPLSGSGARGLMVDVMRTYGVDSFQGKLAAIIQGTTETTFYVLAVYFGSVNIKQTRYALACGLFADFIGMVGAVVVAYIFFK